VIAPSLQRREILFSVTTPVTFMPGYRDCGNYAGTGRHHYWPFGKADFAGLAQGAGRRCLSKLQCMWAYYSWVARRHALRTARFYSRVDNPMTCRIDTSVATIAQGSRHFASLAAMADPLRGDSAVAPTVHSNRSSNSSRLGKWLIIYSRAMRARLGYSRN
jgi:hypothetical protein